VSAPLPRGMRPSTLSRAICAVCHGDVALRNGGVLREHPDHRHELYGVPGAVRAGYVPTCAASGLQVAASGVPLNGPYSAQAKS